MNWKRRFWKWFGYGSTATLLFSAVDPGMFKIPILWQPWIFLTSILWFFLFSTGFFIS